MGTVHHDVPAPGCYSKPEGRSLERTQGYLVHVSRGANAVLGGTSSVAVRKDIRLGWSGHHVDDLILLGFVEVSLQTPKQLLSITVTAARVPVPNQVSKD